MRQRLVPDLSLFFENPNMRQMQVVCSLVSIFFDSPQLGIQQKQTAKTFRLLSQRCSQF